MSTPPIHLAVVTASVRPGRLGPTVAEWFLKVAAQRSDIEATAVDLAELNLPLDLTACPGIDALSAAIGAADAVVVVTPEYNHGYPAALKTALDSVKYEWRGKPIGFVSYGGVSGGLRATEQLRQVAAELHMVSVRDSVMFTRARKSFGGGGTTDDAAVDSAARMLDQIVWWSTATRLVRRSLPYPGR